jgi:hypothetical protein
MTVCQYLNEELLPAPPTLVLVEMGREPVTAEDNFVVMEIEESGAEPANKSSEHRVSLA